jgi:Protein of unknown function (DUF2939)
MNTKTKLSIAIIFSAISIWFYFTPYLTVRAMKSAVEAKDSSKLSDYIDFPAVKENLKVSLNAKFATKFTKEKDAKPYGAFGTLLAAKLITPMIDALVTPESLAMMMKGEKSQSTKGIDQKKPSDSDADITMFYENFDRFVVSVKNKGANEETLGMVFNRDGMFSWKLSSLLLP